jgi:NlpE N-terminal domain
MRAAPYIRSQVACSQLACSLVACSLVALVWSVPAFAIGAPAEETFVTSSTDRPLCQREPSAQPGDAARIATAFYTVNFALQPDADPSGVYQGNAPAADAAKRVFTLNLASDGTAILTTLYIGKNDARQQGRWTRDGSQILLTFDAMGPNRPPHPITFRHRGNALSPIHWDPSEWGRAGPPVLHRSRTKTAGILPDRSAASDGPGQGV